MAQMTPLTYGLSALSSFHLCHLRIDSTSGTRRLLTSYDGVAGNGSDPQMTQM
jgi:hypothetical protein